MTGATPINDAARLWRRIHELRNPKYPDAYKLLGTHSRAIAAVKELEERGLIEHRNNGTLMPLRQHADLEEMADG